MTDQLDIDPAGTALLVMDFQVGLVDRVADAGALLERVNTALADVRAHGGHVAWVRVAFDTADFDAIPPCSVMARMAGPDRRAELHTDAPGSHIHASLSPQPQDITVREAMDRDYRIVVLEDATADPDPDTHAFLTASTFPRHAAVIAVDDLREIWT